VTIVVCSIDSVHLPIYQPSAHGGLSHRDSCIDVSPFSYACPSRLTDAWTLWEVLHNAPYSCQPPGVCFSLSTGEQYRGKQKTVMVFDSPPGSVGSDPRRAEAITVSVFCLAARLDEAIIPLFYAGTAIPSGHNPIRTSAPTVFS
jgi:hypothetical protein